MINGIGQIERAITDGNMEFQGAKRLHLGGYDQPDE